MNSIQPGYKTIWAISRELMNQFVEKLIGRTLCSWRETLLYFRDSNCWKLNNRIISFEITLFIKSLQYNGLPCQISKYDTSERQGLNLQEGVRSFPTKCNLFYMYGHKYVLCEYMVEKDVQFPFPLLTVAFIYLYIYLCI